MIHMVVRLYLRVHSFGWYFRNDLPSPERYHTQRLEVQQR